MPNISLQEVKRMIDIENALIEIKNNGMQINNDNSIEILNLVIDYIGELDIKDMEYIELAIKLPFREIKMYYDAYKYKQDKITEKQFIGYLIRRYNIDKFFIIKRLDQIKRIKNVETKELYHKVNIEENTKGGKQKW